MSEPQRDPEFDWMRPEWRSTRVPPSADAAVLAAWQRLFPVVRPVRRFWLPLAAAALAASVAVVLLQVQPADAEYRPVGQPHIVVLSQGERP